MVMYPHAKYKNVLRQFIHDVGSGYIDAVYYQSREEFSESKTKSKYVLTTLISNRCIGDLLQHPDLPKFSDFSRDARCELDIEYAQHVLVQLFNEISTRARDVDRIYEGTIKLKKFEALPRPENACPQCLREMSQQSGKSTADIRSQIDVSEYPNLSNLGIFNYPKICDVCYESDLAAIRKVERNRRWAEISKTDRAIWDCEQHGTCGIIKVHHAVLGDDPDRLRSSFMIGLTCGADGLRKYLAKRTGTSIDILNRMSDEEVVDYADQFDRIE